MVDAAVERALATGKDAQCQCEANGPTNESNGGEEREKRVSREVVGALTHSGELYRTRGAYRARLSASTGCGMARRTRWCFRMGGRRPELARRKAPSVGDNYARRCGCYYARRCGCYYARAEGRVWQRGRRRTRPGAPGGRPGRVQAAACAPRGGRALSARHGGTARPSARVDTALARARGRGKHGRGEAGPASLAGPVGWRRPATEQPPFPFFLIYFSQKA